MGDYLPGDILSPRKKCQEKLKPGNKPSTKSGQPLQLPDAGTLLAEQIDDLAMSQKRRCDGSLSNKQKNPPISRISGYSETWLRASYAEA